jgi:hypothetical protein
MHKCVFFIEFSRPETRRVIGAKIFNEINELKKIAIFLCDLVSSVVWEMRHS